MIRNAPFGFVLDLHGRKILLDPRKRVERFEEVVVSHPHSDHARLPKKYRTVFCSPETGKVLGVEPTSISCLKLIPSGHGIGATQVIAEDGISLLYSSDFKMEPDLVVDGAETTKADVLILDTTFAHPAFQFPPREEIYSGMANWARRRLREGVVVFFAYPYGKAQEVIAFCNEYLGISPAVHPKIGRVSRLLGLKADFFVPESRRDVELLVLPSKLAGKTSLQALRISLKRRVYGALLTGWAAVMKFAIKAFPLSGHADFQQTLDYVSAISPKLVLTVGLHARYFSRILKKKGFDSAPLQGTISHLLPAGGVP